MMREEVSCGSLPPPLMLFAPCTALGSTQVVPVFVALPQQGLMSWNLIPSSTLLPLKPLPSLSPPKAGNRPRTPKFGA